MVLIENDGALFRGPSRGNPQEVWANGQWKPYADAGKPRDVDWGNVVTEDEAKALMGDDAAADGSDDGAAAAEV